MQSPPAKGRAVKVGFALPLMHHLTESISEPEDLVRNNDESRCDALELGAPIAVKCSKRESQRVGGLPTSS